jgi:uncharacterized protein YdhG (YjbR/CyaY superfamily)
MDVAKSTVMKSIDEYIDSFPFEVQSGLRALRACIRAELPGAVEKISYGLPTFYLYGNIIHYGAFRDHYGIFPGASALDHFSEAVLPYRSGRGTLRFSLEMELPLDLIRQLVRYTVIRRLESKQLVSGFVVCSHLQDHESNEYR